MFITNFLTDARTARVYNIAAKRVGVVVEIRNNATDSLGRPLYNCLALHAYLHGEDLSLFWEEVNNIRSN